MKESKPKISPIEEVRELRRDIAKDHVRINNFAEWAEGKFANMLEMVERSGLGMIHPELKKSLEETLKATKEIGTRNDNPERKIKH